MTRLDPALIVTRLVIERINQVVYDEAFHAGVNIIRGENSSGKSTILNFIFYGLGGDLADWSDTAKLCTRVFVEVMLNGKPATLSREISEERSQPMEIFGGSYELSRKASRDEWTRYPYRRSQNLESFSQTLFRLLGIPEVANDVSGNVTFHQILRLLYADQLSPVENLFKFERFDPPTLRDTIGRLLCGAYDGSLYENELRIRSLEKEFDAVSAELKSLYAVLGSGGSGLTLEWVAGQRAVLDEERADLQQKIESAELAVFTASAADALSLKAQQAAFAELQKIQVELGKARQERENLTLDIADSAAFIVSLETKVTALNDADLVATHIGDVQFQVCPACYATVRPPATPLATPACHLCHTSFDSEKSRGRIVALINDAAVQLRQSRQLQEARLQRLGLIESKLDGTEEKWNIASRRLAELQRLPSSEAREAMRALHRQSGYLERQLEDLEDKAKMIATVDQLQRRKDVLNAEISSLKSKNVALRSSQNKRLGVAYEAIADEVRSLLMHDLRRQDSFENPERVEFDFGSDRISVDGHTYFSASSRVILKSSFFLGFLAAATKHAFFRHPRFCMIDTMEDKGMEMHRSHNFQIQVARVSEESEAEHQVIFATAMIAPDLDEEKYTIGKYSTRDEPTLAIKT